MTELLSNVVWGLALLLWTIGAGQSLLKTQVTKIDHVPKLTRIYENLRQNRRSLIIAGIIIVIAHVIFYVLVSLGSRAGYIGHNSLLEPLKNVGSLLVGLGFIAQAIDSLAKSKFFPEVLRWFTATVCLSGYFAFYLWFLNAASTPM